jgi:hypothetical protein
LFAPLKEKNKGTRAWALPFEGSIALTHRLACMSYFFYLFFQFLFRLKINLRRKKLLNPIESMTWIACLTGEAKLPGYFFSFLLSYAFFPTI